jgi:hypothetical protein
LCFFKIHKVSRSLFIRNSIEKNTNRPEENRQPAPHYSPGSPDTEPFHRSCSSRFSLSTFFWAARPAFYYMEFIFLFVIAPFILLIATSYWPLYRVLRKKKNFPFAEARSLLPC